MGWCTSASALTCENDSPNLVSARSGWATYHSACLWGWAEGERGLMGDIASLVSQMMQYITAAIGAYGTAVWAKTQETVADETVSLGRRLLQRLARREESRPQLEAAVADVVEAPEDEDFVAALRAQIKKALAADASLADDIAAMLKTSPIVAGPGSQIISGSHIGGDVIQIGTAGDVTIHRRN